MRGNSAKAEFTKPGTAISIVPAQKRVLSLHTKVCDLNAILKFLLWGFGYLKYDQDIGYTKIYQEIYIISKAKKNVLETRHGHHNPFLHHFLSQCLNSIEAGLIN